MVVQTRYFSDKLRLFWRVISKYFANVDQSCSSEECFVDSIGISLHESLIFFGLNLLPVPCISREQVTSKIEIEYLV